MPENLPLLREIRIRISGPQDDAFAVTTTLLEQQQYPPAPERQNHRLIFPEGNVAHENPSINVPVQVMRSASLALAADLKSLAVREFVSGPLLELTSAIFEPPALDFLSLLPQPLLAPYPSQPKEFYRLVVAYEDAALDEIPWELMPSPWGEVGQSCTVVRRTTLSAGEKSGQFDLPLNVAIASLTDKISDDNVSSWANTLFDNFTGEARRLGGIEWDVVNPQIKVGEAHHIIFDSADARSFSKLEKSVRRIGLLSESREWSQPPRLLVLHDISAQASPFLSTSLVRTALQRGVDVVLLVATDTTDPSVGNFFPTFYRKVMHNWPLDQSVWAADCAARANASLIDSVFGAREGGEFALLLTRAVLEAVQPRIAPERIQRRARGRPGAKKAVGRVSKVATDLINETRRGMSETRAEVLEVERRLNEVSFDEEEHGVAEIVDARGSVEDVRRSMVAGERLVEALETAEPDELKNELVRLTNVWITEKDGQEPQRVISPNSYLVRLRPYQMHLLIGPKREGAIVSERFNEASLHRVFEKLDEVFLDVMFFSPSSDFKLEGDNLELHPANETSMSVEIAPELVQTTTAARWGAHAKLRLPRYGSSNELQISITPLSTGVRRIRTCIYYRNVLLQSVLLEANVAHEDSAEARGEKATTDTVITGRTTDYVATVDFALLDDLPQPSINIFTNDDGAGTHWIGAFSSGDTEAFQLKKGDMRTFEEATLNTRAQDLRDVLIKIEGESSYKFNAKFPLGDQDLKWREGYLRDLAISGWRLFHPLFVVDSNADGDSAERLESFRNTTKDSHIVSIARCGRNSATLPWAALYTNPIESNKPDQIKLCEVFKKQLAANKWTGSKLVEKHDLLDDPKACRSLPECPLSTDKRKLTVCPFGFWGYLHQVEQPLQQVKPTPVDEIPAELEDYDFGQTSFLTWRKGDSFKIAMGTYPAIPEVTEHCTEIQELNKISTVQVDYKDERDQIMALLKKSGQHVYYFYCHGDIDQQHKLFRLKLGPASKPGYIESADLLPDEIKWQTPKPLFIMNGCETMAVTPDVTHGFMHTLKWLGASGIVGTEIKVWTQLARPFGLQLLTGLLAGMSVGEAFLEVRKYLLRQLNPLGLIYTYYSPATLHLHDPNDCDWCDSHLR